jgi:hypothetical protein
MKDKKVKQVQGLVRQKKRVKEGENGGSMYSCLKMEQWDLLSVF